MIALFRDFRFAVRTLTRTPGFTVAALLCLALAIGVNAALFSVVEAVLLRSLPYQEPDRLVMVWNQMVQRELPHLWSSDAEFLDYRSQSSSFQSLAAYFDPVNVNLTGVDEPERLQAGLVSANFFDTLGASAESGRTFAPEEDRPGQQTVAVVSHDLAQRLFGGQAVGETLTLNDETYSVVGVMPPDFHFFPDSVDLWVPLSIDPENLDNRSYRYLFLVGRLAPGVGLGQAQAEMSTIGDRFQRDYPEAYPDDSGWGVQVLPLRDEIVGDVRLALLTLSVAVLLVLLIACVNVANLLLARSTARSREVAVRSALGAGRPRLLRQFLVEGVVLSGAGGALGLLFAYGLLRVLRRLAPADLPRLHEVSLDLGVLGVVLAACAVTGLVFGLIPALRTRRGDFQASLKEGAAASAGTGRGQRRALDVLVAVEVALSLALLIAAGLVLRSFFEVRNTDPGFDADATLTFRVSLPGSRYPDTAQQVAFLDELQGRIARLPQVRSVGEVTQLPLSGSDFMGRYRAEGADPQAEDDGRIADWRPVRGDYFQAMGIRLLQGESLETYEGPDAPDVVVVDGSLARRYWPDESAIGKRIWLTGLADDGPPRRIVGVVEQVHHSALDEAPREQIYLPFRQLPRASVYFAVRAAGESRGLVPLVRSQVRELDPDLPISEVASMSELLGKSLAQRRFSTSLFLVFAAVAALLAILGVYGVMAYAVARRTHELGLRMALGARRKDLFAEVMKRGMWLVLGGVILGWGLALGSTRFLSSLLYGVEPGDLVTFLGVAALLVGVALVAMLLPARRATVVDPLVALKYE